MYISISIIIYEIIILCIYYNVFNVLFIPYRVLNTSVENQFSRNYHFHGTLCKKKIKHFSNLMAKK